MITPVKLITISTTYLYQSVILLGHVFHFEVKRGTVTLWIAVRQAAVHSSLNCESRFIWPHGRQNFTIRLPRHGHCSPLGHRGHCNTTDTMCMRCMCVHSKLQWWWRSRKRKECGKKNSLKIWKVHQQMTGYIEGGKKRRKSQTFNFTTERLLFSEQMRGRSSGTFNTSNHLQIFVLHFTYWCCVHCVCLCLCS